MLTEAKIKEYLSRLALSRLRILNDHGFYGLLLMHMKFGLEETCPTAYTDGYKIVFGTKFLDKITNKEIDFVMMHEIMHVVLKHCFRGNNYDPFTFNIACDIVVNSNILKSNNMDFDSISVGNDESMHLAPDKKEGYEYTAEEVYEMLKKQTLHKKIVGSTDGNEGKVPTGCDNLDLDSISAGFSDDHSKWVSDNGEGQKTDDWDQRLINAINLSKNRGSEIPNAALRAYDLLTNSVVDWRLLLKEFISFDITDYSFTPPDKRYSDYDFYLPDYNEESETTNINVLFEIDTSGSITDKLLGYAYSEIKGAIEEFNGGIKGWLGFYDTRAYDITPFSNVDDVLKIKPIGGGGTDCSSIFKSLDKFKEKAGSIDAIIIITDGYDEFPKESVRENIPVFWLITNNEITPPWGVIARIIHK